MAGSPLVHQHATLPLHHENAMASASLLISSVLLAACAIGGCSAGQDRKADTVLSTGIVLTDVTMAKQQLSLATQALTDLRDATQTDDLQLLREAIVSSQLGLAAALARVDANGTSAVAAGKLQSLAWQEKANAFTDSALRAASQQREGVLRDAVAALETSCLQLHHASQQHHDQAGQIISALDLDRSFPGTRSIVPSVDRLVADTAQLHNALGEVADRAIAVSTANDD